MADTDPDENAQLAEALSKLVPEEVTVRRRHMRALLRAVNTSRESSE